MGRFAHIAGAIRESRRREEKRRETQRTFTNLWEFVSNRRWDKNLTQARQASVFYFASSRLCVK